MRDAVSLRTVRQHVKAQADAIRVIDSAVGNIGAVAQQCREHLETLPPAKASFWQRLRWLVRGNG